VPQTRTAGFGPRSFSVTGLLASEIKTTSLTLGQFSGRLKAEIYTLYNFIYHKVAKTVKKIQQRKLTTEKETNIN